MAPTPPPTQTALTREQLSLSLIIAAVQFVNILDFVIVMPLGPMFAAALGFSEAHIGYIAGAYTAAAAVAGLLAAGFLDRFDRRAALGVCMLGLVAGTALGGLATGFGTLLAARVVAGAFGGPATSLALSIISDVIPPEVRGRAVGVVMGAFSISQVIGVPTGVWIGEHLGWRAPFFTVAGAGLLLAVTAVTRLPSLTAHIAEARAGAGRTSTLELLSRPLVQTSLSLTAFVMMAGFSLIPNIAGFVQLNRGVPLEDLKFLYLAGGIASLVTLQVAGRLIDRFGSFNVGTAGSVGVALVVWSFFWPTNTFVPPLLGFILLMTFMGVRNVSHTTLTTKVPRAPERARFQSLQSAVQHAASAAGAFLSANLLSRALLQPTDGLPERWGLSGMERVVVLCLGLTLVVPLLMRRVEAGVRAGGAQGGEARGIR